MNLGLASAHPVRTPGPAIFENVPEERALPNDSLEGVGERVASMSTRRGRRAWGSEGEEVGEEVGEGEMGHWRES